MSRRFRAALWGLPLVLVCTVLGLRWVGAFGGAVGEDSLRVERAAETEFASAELLETEGRGAPPAAATPSSQPASLSREPAGPRTDVGSVSAPVEPPAAPAIPLHGVVLDARGRPVPSVTVEFIPDFEESARTPKDFANSRAPQVGGIRRFPSTPSPDGSIFSSDSPGGRGAAPRINEFANRRVLSRLPRVTTDAAGAFEFRDYPARTSGTLSFGHELFAGTPPSQVVIPDGGEQSLFLPARPSATPLVRIALRARASGLGLYPARVRPRLTALPPAEPESAESGRVLPRRALREPRPDQILRGDGWVELQLWPGKWIVELNTERSETIEVQVDVPRSGPTILLDVDLRVFDPEGGWEPLNATSEVGFVPNPETAEGFDRFGAEASPTRQIGERSSDHTFRHTLRFGVGEVSAAFLELDLEAVSGMSYNDSLGLEFYAGPRFGFSNRISAIAGGDWRAPVRRRLTVDLSNLPGTNGPVNLLPDLADGRLDVYVQDDTAVHDVRLFVQR